MITEAEILSKRTASGGWSRDDLAAWGVPWPPPRGWKQALIEGKSCTVAASQSTDIARLYWESNILVGEIIDAYDLDNCTNQGLAKLAGLGLIVGKACRCCAGPLTVSSRTEAAEKLSRLWAGDGDRYAEWARPEVCSQCSERLKKQSERSFSQRFNTEEQRRRRLASMPYGEYIQTPEWQSTRQAALRRARFKCQTCAGGGELHVHHRTYIRRGREYASDLIVLCAGCHSLFHQNGRLAEGGRAA